MTRKEVIGNCELYLGDCREILPSLGTVDAVVTDPPYGIGEDDRRNASRGKPISRSQSARLAFATDYGKSAWDYATADEAVASAIAIARWSVVFGGNYYDLPPTKCWLVWDKLNGDSDFADCELAWTNLPKAVRRIRFLWNGCMRRERDIAREHPTQKPVEVMRWCIGHLPADARTILDPFMGSGTTLVAAVSLGRAGIGIERDKRYFDIACKRIAAAYAQPDLFVAPPEPKPQQLNLLEAAE